MSRPRFLIDENLSIELPAVAHAAGFECQHVNDIGLRTKGDPILMRRIIDENWTLVTNNWREFMARYKARAPVHAGLVLLVAANGLTEQQLAFKLVIHVVDRQCIDLTNLAVLVERDGDDIGLRQIPWPE